MTLPATSTGAVDGSTPAEPLPMDQIESQELTPDQVAQWTEGLSHMMWKAGAFQHLFYKLLSQSNKAGQAPHVAKLTRSTSIAATDGCDIMINPDNFFKFTIPERTFILSHEVLHNVFQDVPLIKQCTQTGKVLMSDGTTMPFNNPSMQRAMDLRIDGLLIQSRIGKAPKISVDRLAEHKLKAEEAAVESVVDLYKRVYQEDDDNSGGFDQVLPGGNAPGAPQPKTQQQWMNEIAVARTIEQGKRAIGSAPSALERMFNKLLTPEIPWTEHIRGIVQRNVGSGSKTWKKPDRRFIGQDIYLPSTTGFGCNWLIIGGDTSGSITDAELCAYTAEIKTIIEDCRPRRLTVVWWDAAVQNVEELDDCSGMDDLHPKGGGGSDSRPFFDWIRENGYEPPDMAVVFTDLCIRFPDHEPPMPLIWATVDKAGKAPFGEVVIINKRKGP